MNDPRDDEWLYQLQQLHPYFQLSSDEDQRLYQFSQDVQSPEFRQQMLESLIGTVGVPATYETATNQLRKLVLGTPEQQAAEKALQDRYMSHYSPSELEQWMKQAQEHTKKASMKGYKPSTSAARDTQDPMSSIYNALIFALGGAK
jgi:phosphoribosyl-AMP cyclohydrolase